MAQQVQFGRRVYKSEAPRKAPLWGRVFKTGGGAIAGLVAFGAIVGPPPERNVSPQAEVAAHVVARVAAHVEAPAAGFGSFDNELARIRSALGPCEYSASSPADELGGRGYFCIRGRAETAKLFMNEDQRSGRLLDVKVMWNRWKEGRPDAGADQGEVSAMARAVIRLYAPEAEDAIMDAYWGTKAAVFEKGGYRFAYRWTPGPGINEHLLTVTSIH